MSFPDTALHGKQRQPLCSSCHTWFLRVYERDPVQHGEDVLDGRLGLAEVREGSLSVRNGERQQEYGEKDLHKRSTEVQPATGVGNDPCNFCLLRRTLRTSEKFICPAAQAHKACAYSCTTPASLASSMTRQLKEMWRSHTLLHHDTAEPERKAECREQNEVRVATWGVQQSVSKNAKHALAYMVNGTEWASAYPNPMPLRSIPTRL